MNRQFFPGLTETYIQQEHARLLEEATRSRMLRQVKTDQPLLPVIYPMDVQISKSPSKPWVLLSVWLMEHARLK